MSDNDDSTAAIGFPPTLQKFLFGDAMSLSQETRERAYRFWYDEAPKSDNPLALPLGDDGILFPDDPTPQSTTREEGT